MDCTTKKWPISLRGIVHLAAPHTWPAAVLPVLLGTSLSFACGVPVHSDILLYTLATAVLLQAAVNTLNDYRDYLSGLDSEDNCTDPTDAALIYDCSSPRTALTLGLVFLFGAAVFGGLLILIRGVAMLTYGGLALAAILLYTLPYLSLSDLPLGELLSGGTMGGVLTCASYHAQAGAFSWDLLYLCLPAVVTIGCIMLVNNTSDIEKDQQGGRVTLPICIGRRGAQILLRIAVVSAALAVLLIITCRFPRGIAAMPVMFVALLVSQPVCDLYFASVTFERRKNSMTAILQAHTWIIASYSAAAVLSCIDA